ncbi:permease-like cell division protein FtsX [Tissierella pigra]|uniref:Cell division protein FtsX n=1 Tax=Tissierella pigra TaxID=2607614 RepID=A0A6N7XT46_9FIRM|nr:permease-like cell division protein FtsX [Tissierella pigra]MBU5427390.1 permease-like cell division protein FtsX [Tissierella pigra]MSU00937.1 ABC transporter permease [Tissierella pigra]
MGFRVFKNILKQGFQGMWRNRSMGLASIGSISAVLMILGVVIILVLSINNVAMEIKTKFDEIQVFLKDDLTAEDIDKIQETIEEDDRVLSVVFQSKGQGLEIMKKDWEEDSYLLEGLEEDNPLQDSYIIQLKDIKDADDVVKKLDTIEGIEYINYYKDIIDKLLVFANYIRFGGIVVIGILVLVSVFIISNTIKITVTSRKREVNIMKYVGATNGYIRGPFIIEGILFGLIGSVLSIFIINYGYDYFFKSVSDKLYVLFTVWLVPPTLLMKDITIMFSAIGVGIGALGSIVSLKRFLNV